LLCGERERGREGERERERESAGERERGRWRERARERGREGEGEGEKERGIAGEMYLLVRERQGGARRHLRLSAILHDHQQRLRQQVAHLRSAVLVTPYTLHPTPYTNTLHPTPFTPHHTPTPYTLHPTPTLELRVLGFGVWVLGCRVPGFGFRVRTVYGTKLSSSGQSASGCADRL